MRIVHIYNYIDIAQDKRHQSVFAIRAAINSKSDSVTADAYLDLAQKNCFCLRHYPLTHHQKGLRDHTPCSE
ncbi:hypothetical protein B6G00_15145 [Salinivibrio sp. YCSC6]|nr:hypothetical protein BGK46_02145 [Salinivibrio sp. DV]PCE65316.1 hypothetical protein B6G00_15145 [Salinivibrio sp. YCSC6]